MGCPWEKILKGGGGDGGGGGVKAGWYGIECLSGKIAG